MASMPYKQDLPPEGGYAPINYKRIPAKSVLNAPIIFAGLFGTMAYGYWSYKRGMRAFRKEVSKYNAFKVQSKEIYYLCRRSR